MQSGKHTALLSLHLLGHAGHKSSIDEELLTFTHFAQYFAQRAQAKHAESASLGEQLQQQQVRDP